LLVTKSDPGQFLPTSVQKSYFMLSRSVRAVLDTALRKYHPGRTDLIPVGGIVQLKPALRLMTSYRLTIRDVVGNEVLTSYTRWLEFVQVKEGPDPEVYVAFSPRFERIWLESKKRLPEYMEQKPANAALRSQYSLRLYNWAKKYVEDGARTISLEELRRVFGVASVKDADGNVIREAPLPVWANFQQRALDVDEINKKTDLKIKVSSLERSKQRRVVGLNFTIKIQAIPKTQRDRKQKLGEDLEKRIERAKKAKRVPPTTQEEWDTVRKRYGMPTPDQPET
jgi:plasmid replication initiation protein